MKPCVSRVHYHHSPVHGGWRGRLWVGYFIIFKRYDDEQTDQSGHTSFQCRVDATENLCPVERIFRQLIVDTVASGRGSDFICFWNEQKTKRQSVEVVI